MSSESLQHSGQIQSQDDRLRQKNRRRSRPAFKFSVREICFSAILGAMLFALKMALAFLPNIEPVSLITIVLAQKLGWRGLLALYVYIACELLVWGIGPWTICYLYVWLLLFIPACLLKKLDSAWFWAFAGAVFGFLFGLFCALPIWLISGFQAALAWWQAGVPFDLLHGISNFTIILLLYHPLRRIFSLLPQYR